MPAVIREPIENLRIIIVFVLAILLASAFAAAARAQALTQTTLKVDLQNAVEYQADIADPLAFATKPGTTPSTPPKNFYEVTLIGDIVAVNGQPAKGTYVGRTHVVSLNPNASGTPAAEAVADVTRTALREQVFEILQPNGTPIGSVMSMGFSGGPAPPGSPSSERGNWAIVGGTGAFLGARGRVAGTGGIGRAASAAEDPLYRRINGGTSYSFLLYVIPMQGPQIIPTASGPAVTHSIDFSFVNAAKPAAAGEILSLFVTGMGPTVPAVDLGSPFPSNPLAFVNSPVAVTINGTTAEVLAAVGLPGSTSEYQVNIRLPSNVAKGAATLELSAAWISSPAVSIAVQ